MPAATQGGHPAMSEDPTADKDEFFRRVHGELLDSIDEELEMELDDERLSAMVGPRGTTRAIASAGSISRNCSGCRASS